MKVSTVNSDSSSNLNDGMASPDDGTGETEKAIIKQSEKNTSEVTSKDNRCENQVKAGQTSKDDGVENVCPFVCGICSEKFDKVAVFYAHLKTHESFAQVKQKKILSGALESQEIIDDNVFRCGICWLEFPSMSLLHEHMLKDENISDYSYSNADHTARPDSRIVKSQSDSDIDTKENQSAARSPRKGLSSKSNKKKSGESSTSGTQTVEKHMDTSIGDDLLKVNESSDRVKQKKIIKSKKKRNFPETNEPKKKRKTENCSEKLSPTIHTYSARGNLSPITRSSRRVSCKRVDYKALAGLSSQKYSSSEDESADTTETIAPDIEVESCNVKKEQEELEAESQAQQKDLTIETEAYKLDKDQKVIKNVVKCQKKTLDVQVLSVKNEKRDKLREKITSQELSNKTDEKLKETKINCSENHNEEIEESETLTDTDKDFEGHGVKEDGTSADDDEKKSNITTHLEDDSEYNDNASDFDSDDDFREDEAFLVDEQNDPDFEPQTDSGDDDGDGEIVSIDDTQDPNDYLKKFKVKKKKRIYKNAEGQPIKNCLYPCSVCGRYYLWKALKKHMYAHVTTRIVQCKQCKKKYKSDRHLKDHIRSVHEMKKYGCPKCSSILKGNQSFEKHIMTHILKNEITEALDEVPKIEVSDEDYMKLKALQENKLPKNPNKKKRKPFEVEVKKEGLDLETIKEGPLYGEHIVLESNIVGTSKNQDCKICKKHFATHESLLTHMIEHKDEKHFSCKICKGFFQTQEHLQNHMTTVHGERDLECDICGEHLRSHYALWSHKGKHLMKKDKYYSEEIVQKLQEEIAERKKIKKQSGAYGSGKKGEMRKCEVCGLPVMSVRYARHLEVHTTTKDWECEICHNFYKTRRYLIDHKKKTHFAAVVSCDICGQKFKGKTYLEIHKQTHGPKDKKCPHCDKGFTTMMYLKTHLLTHEEKKRFRCERCMAAFSHKQRLTIHMVEVHGEGASRPCKYCGDLFPSRQKARRHERVAHEGFVIPTRVKRKSGYVNFIKMNENDNESLQHKIVRLMPSGSGLVSVTPGIFTVPVSKNNVNESDVQNSVDNKITHLTDIEDGEVNEQYIKFGNGEEYQVMIKKEDSQRLEFVELTEDEQNVVIQEAAETATVGDEQGEENVEQVLEIPENAEQCQILLYPDGSFKLLNVVDSTNQS